MVLGKYEVLKTFMEFTKHGCILGISEIAKLMSRKKGLPIFEFLFEKKKLKKLKKNILIMLLNIYYQMDF